MDRRQVEAERSVEPSRTNEPDGLSLAHGIGWVADLVVYSLLDWQKTTVIDSTVVLLTIVEVGDDGRVDTFSHSEQSR